MPKRNLVSSVQVALQSGRLKIAEDLALAETLRKELLNFRVKVNVSTAHDSYEAWREGDHERPGARDRPCLLEGGEAARGGVVRFLIELRVTRTGERPSIRINPKPTRRLTRDGQCQWWRRFFGF